MSASSATNTPEVELTILIIATRNYVGFARELITTIDRLVRLDGGVQILVFTDQPGFFEDLQASVDRLDVISIPSLGWPYATLLRFGIFENNWHAIRGRSVMYLDADTRIVSSLSSSQFCGSEWQDGVALVEHPGFFGRSPWIRLLMRIGFGPWETRRRSRAFVPIGRRNRYVCGGVWMGRRDSIRTLVEDLSSRVRADLRDGLIAVWHDESHLNNWYSRNRCSVLDSRWAYSHKYDPKLRSFGLTPIIQVIDKPLDWLKG
jgi:histo-blood group ABO system transferase